MLTADVGQPAAGGTSDGSSVSKSD